MDFDLFGNPVIPENDLRAQFLEPPFSVLDTKTGSWQSRRNAWKALGIRSEVGRDAKTFNITEVIEEKVSIFDPSLCEILYKWFSPESGSILDPFAGGSVRGVVAAKMGRKYLGIDIREEQITSNREQASEIVPENLPEWVVGDSFVALDEVVGSFDCVFSCPPYADLEVYSDLPGDISNMEYPAFISSYRAIIKKAVSKLKPNCYAVFVVGEVRGKGGGYLGFVPDTIRAFMDCGMLFYNEAILLNSIGSAAMRANGNMKSGKLAKVHQNILVFKKPMKSIENGLA